MTAHNRADVLRWDRLLDLTTVLPGQAVLLSFESLLSSTASVALVQVSTDGISWTTVAMPSSAPDWQQQVIDLTGYVGADDAGAVLVAGSGIERRAARG